MFYVSRFLTVVLVCISTASSVQAYATQPKEAVTNAPDENVRVAEACAPSLSPQMAAAFGLPMRPPGVTRACTHR